VTAAWFSDLRNRSLTARSLLLGLVTLGVLTVAAPVGFVLSGPPGVWAAAAGAGLCLAGAVAALVVSDRLHRSEHALHAALLGMAARMAIPLGLGFTLYLLSRPLANAGLLYYLLVFYPVTLSVETMLSWPPRRRTAGSQASQRDTTDG